ncbi:MAG TPA: hypothetical protein VF741_04220 [Candidatus Aquilonibacter sp.]
MRALLAIFFLLFASRATHNDNLRANQFETDKRFSPWVAMLPHFKDGD